MIVYITWEFNATHGGESYTKYAYLQSHSLIHWLLLRKKYIRCNHLVNNQMKWLLSSCSHIYNIYIYIRKLPVAISAEDQKAIYNSFTHYKQDF